MESRDRKKEAEAPATLPTAAKGAWTWPFVSLHLSNLHALDHEDPTGCPRIPIERTFLFSREALGFRELLPPVLGQRVNHLPLSPASLPPSSIKRGWSLKPLSSKTLTRQFSEVGRRAWPHSLSPQPSPLLSFVTSLRSVPESQRGWLSLFFLYFYQRVFFLCEEKKKCLP